MKKLIFKFLFILLIFKNIIISISEMVDYYMKTCDMNYHYNEYLKNKLNQNEK